MGITIHYRGRLADLTGIEDFEDRLVDLALELGGLAQIHRSHAEAKPECMVRGVILNLAPGLETTSLLISPEGWLISLWDVKDAQEGRLSEPPWCFTKTQFGPIDGHVALVEMLTELKREFIPDLEISDEGGYYPNRDLAELTRRRGLLDQAIAGLAEGMQRHALSPEAAEDPAIVLQRIERIAAQVHRLLKRPAEHPPIEFPDDITSAVPDPEAEEALGDEMFKHNRRQQERMNRSIEESLSRGEDHEQAFDNAIGDLGLEVPGEEEDDEPWKDDDREEFAIDSEPEADFSRSESDYPFEPDQDERHPLLRQAMDILHRLHEAFKGADKSLESSLYTLFQGAGDTMGGLAQALSGDDDDPDDYGLRLSQLKRAMRGAAFTRGALLHLRGALKPDEVEELFRTIGQMQKDIFALIRELRSEQGQ